MNSRKAEPNLVDNNNNNNNIVICKAHKVSNNAESEAPVSTTTESGRSSCNKKLIKRVLGVLQCSIFDRLICSLTGITNQRNQYDHPDWSPPLSFYCWVPPVTDSRQALSACDTALTWRCTHLNFCRTPTNTISSSPRSTLAICRLITPFRKMKAR